MRPSSWPRATELPEAIGLMRQRSRARSRRCNGSLQPATLLISTASGQKSNALDEYRKASALNPEDTTFLENLGMSLEINGDLNEALVALRKATELEPGSAAFEFNLGYAMEWNGDVAGAMDALEKASTLGGNNELASRNRLVQGLRQVRPSLRKPHSQRKKRSIWR